MNSSPARIGYARVSTADQNLDAQTAALEAARCTMVRTETGGGATLTGRPELRTLLDFIHPGETLVVTRIDRLARSMRNLRLIVATLKDKGAHLAATEQPVDTSTAAGKAFFDMLGVFAEFETNLRRERQAEGVAAAKQRCAYRGRPPRIDMEAIKHRLTMGLSMIGALLGHTKFSTTSHCVHLARDSIKASQARVADSFDADFFDRKPTDGTASAWQPEPPSGQA